MKSSIKSLLSGAALLAAALATAPAQAVQYTGATFSSAAASNSVVSYGADAAQSFDVNFGVLTATTLNFITMGDEVASTMSFNALVNNFTGYNFDGLTVKLTGGAVFVTPHGTVTPTFGVVGGTGVTADLVSSWFSTGDGYAVNFGNPLAQDGQADWAIDFSAVTSGSTFGITVTAVPEPETYAMLLAGLGMMAGIARRRRNRR